MEAGMLRRIAGGFGVVGIAVVASVVLTAQAPARSARGGTVVPRTPDGKPDLQGTWDFRTVTPMERPAEFANKPFLTEQEAAEYEKRITESRNADANRDESKKTSRGQVNGAEVTADVALAYNDFWWDRGTRVIGSRRTSLVIDPPDGRIPPMTAEARARVEKLDAARERPAEGPEDRSVGERCLLGFNAGPPFAPGGYNMNIQIVQTPTAVMLMNEMVHTARVIPLDGRPFLNLPQWSGTSRGRWEGDTLVVETKGFKGETSFRGSSPNLHLIERFTRADADTLVYQFTANDPTTWTRPWTVEIPLRRTDDLIYEYACHEANYGMTNLLQGARAVERDAATGSRTSASRP
jgi:hypothetical protein